MDIQAQTAAPDLTPATRVYSEPGRLSAAVHDMLDFTEADMCTLMKLGEMFDSPTIAAIARHCLARNARVRAELRAAFAAGPELRHADPEARYGLTVVGKLVLEGQREAAATA